MSDLSAFEDFLKTKLAPEGATLLEQFYQSYRNGEDLDVAEKDDRSPASRADRETEKHLRDLIAQAYPDHGIYGEEFGAFQTDRDYNWILDPLDGTREFLAGRPNCFGMLIGLLYKGKPVLGCIADPLSGEKWIAAYEDNATQHTGAEKKLSEARLACTNPEGMFVKAGALAAFEKLKENCRSFAPKKNCIGFAELADGGYDLVIESDLKVHDIVPLLPVLWKVGITTLDTCGDDYRYAEFTAFSNDQTYSIIAANSSDLAEQAYGDMKDYL